MALNIRNKEVDELAEALVRVTGETKTDAVRVALHERLARVRKVGTGHTLADQLTEIGKHCAALPRLDERSDEDILGYDEQGLPG